MSSVRRNPGYTGAGRKPSYLARSGLSWPEVIITGHVCVYVICIFAVALFPGIGVDVKVLYVLGLMYAGLLSVFLLWYVRFADDADRLLCNLIVLYMTVGFSAKLPFMLYFPSTLWINEGMLSFSPAWIIQNLPDTFAIYLLGYSGLAFGMFVYFLVRQSGMKEPSIRHNFAPPEPFRLGWLTTAVFCLLVLKWLLHQFYSIGSPGVMPEQLPIPDLTGIMGILVQQGLLYLVNLGVLIALVSKRKRTVFLYAIFALIFVAMNVIFSRKGYIFIEPFILLWIYIINRNWIPRRTARLAITVGVLIIVVGLPAYTYLNSYRANLNKGTGFTTAALSVAENEGGAASRNPITAVYARVVGLDVLEAASQSSLSKISGSGNPFTADVADQFKQQVIGVGKNQVVGFAFTQFGRSYALSGYWGMVAYMMVLGLVFFLIYHGALRYLLKRSASRAVLSAVLGVVFVHYLMSGASPLLTVKTLAVVFVVAILTEKVLEARGRASAVRTVYKRRRYT